MKTIIYHHGYVPTAEVNAAIAASLVKVPCRNADYFGPGDTEKAETVVVDQGLNTKAIRKAYEAKGVTVITVDEFIKQLGVKKPEKAPAPEKAPFDPDAPVTDEKPVKRQGATVKTPKAPKAPSKPEKAPASEKAPEVAGQ